MWCQIPHPSPTTTVENRLYWGHSSLSSRNCRYMPQVYAFQFGSCGHSTCCLLRLHNSVALFLLTREWGRLDTARPPVALGSSSELSAFSMSLAVVSFAFTTVLLCLIDSRVKKIRYEASSCPGIFSRTLRFEYVSSRTLRFFYVLGCNRLVSRPCPFSIHSSNGLGCIVSIYVWRDTCDA